MKTQTCQSNQSQWFQVMDRIQLYHVDLGTCCKISLDHEDYGGVGASWAQAVGASWAQAGNVQKYVQIQ